MKISKTQSYSLLAAMLAVAGTAAAHRTRIQPFGPELGHQQYHIAGSASSMAAMTRGATPLSSSITMDGDDVVSFFSGSPADPKKVATDFVQQQLTSSDYVVKNAYTSKHNGVTHVYLRQVINGLEVVNGDINVNVDKDGNVISFGDSFYKGNHNNIDSFSVRRNDGNSESMTIREWLQQEGESLLEQGRQLAFGGRRRRGSPHRQNPIRAPEGKDVKSPQEALMSFARFLNIEIPRPEDMDIVTTVSLNSDKVEVMMTNCPLTADGKVPVNQAYIQTEEGTLELVYDLQVEMKDTDNWFHVQVHAETGKVMQVVDWVSDATFNVYPMGVNDPEDGKRKLVVNPEHPKGSPLGWNRQAQNKNFTTTIGNNVFAGENRRNGRDWENNPKPEGVLSKDGHLTFDFKIDLKKDPATYVDAAVTNLFYWNNQMHDVFHHYGFDEESGNFQENNFGRGGIGNDAVIANAQDGSGYNNANFATPPDGQHGQMRMYVWDVTEVPRDGDLESGIIIHEYAHGISTRLTGGPANSGCLGWGEAGGMGEGWGDFFATLFRQNEKHTYESEFEMGAYANGGKGIRRFPYSTSMKTNPETFKFMDGPAYWGVHAKGEVWAQMLFEVYQNLRLRLPFTDNWYTKDKTHYANTLALQLVVDGMKLQPCMPSFIQARDAIIQAEKILTRGKYRCDIWRGFSKRGLGTKARVIGANSPFGSIRTQSFVLPVGCEE
ncbi:Fungalysin/Thermolysin Extracellular metalloproteinase 5 [Lobosporangium transversale]|uniref:Extracellular metalloproteinase n=1 Tax=Lobosporangium transversale TaxID=64571 RepID=A0A1Y2GQ60_9FUNG|nr:Fungalysin metallopeptidase-domain-containing protein [Lobosporangium transversale]KAF9916182.1 Fungalysin/Thermolysin Extracellular metalloproteinase 5 [Lobosporangium transversale]ORZ16054.1 Fungalysin metallopeptidase-domain-containing protein [Lobosporangium transversale]|eukprot:XP_021881401.1 Fungalysin metallopeptidase-domain-containing protein [Lobosporangium transversale]